MRDLGGLIVIDFIDMSERQHNAEVEKVFKKALSVDRARIQLSRISKFGMLELSRQKKQSTIQEISYTTCPHCKGTGLRPALEYIALSAFRKIESQAVKGQSSHMKVTLPYAVSDYLLNQKRSEISRIEAQCEMTIHISGEPDMPWDEVRIQTTERPTLLPSSPGADRMKAARSEPDPDEETVDEETIDELAAEDDQDGAPTPEVETTQPPMTKKKSRRRSRHKKRKVHDTPEETVSTEAGVPKPPAFPQGPGGDETERKKEEDTAAAPATVPTIQESSEAPAATETPKPAKRSSGRKRASRSSRSKKAKADSEASGGTPDTAEAVSPSPTPASELPDGARNELLERLRSVFEPDDE